jgi:hypothetical protein
VLWLSRSSHFWREVSSNFFSMPANIGAVRAAPSVAGITEWRYAAGFSIGTLEKKEFVMKINLRQRLGRAACSCAAAAAVSVVGIAAGQQSQAEQQQPGSATQTGSATGQSQSGAAASDTRRQQVAPARQDTRDSVQNSREQIRDERQTGRESVAGERQNIREARRELRDERREFRAERVRSGDFGLWLRRAAKGLTVADVNRRGAMGQAGLQEGDEIVSVNGQHVSTEREFLDALFANYQANQAAKIVVNRNGQQQTISINPNVLVDEHVRGSNRLHEYGIILDDTNPDQLKVQSVVPRSPAFYAGLRRGDQITGVRGQRITALTGLIRSLASNAGQTTPIDVSRNNQERQLDIEVPSDANAEARTALRPTYPGVAPNNAAPNTPSNLAPPLPQPNPQR